MRGRSPRKPSETTTTMRCCLEMSPNEAEKMAMGRDERRPAAALEGLYMQ